MKELDAYKFQQEIRLFMKTLAPSSNQMRYLLTSKIKIKDELLKESATKKESVERCLLVALCGELSPCSTEKQQAEFATRLLLLDLLTEQV